MNFSKFTFCTIWLQIFYCFGLCQENKYGNSLVVTKEKGEFKLTKPIHYDSETKGTIFKAPEKGKTFHFCVSPEKYKEHPFWYQVESVAPNEEVSNYHKCVETIQTNIVWVYNAEDLKKNPDWNYTEMALFHVGFMLKPQRNIVKQVGRKLNFITLRAQYWEWNSNFQFVTLFEIYQNLVSIPKRMVAIRYTLLSTNLPYEETLYYSTLIPVLANKTKKFNVFDCSTGSADYVKCFENILSQSWIRKLRNMAEHNTLSTIMIVPTEHFPIPTWRSALQYPVNFYPMWQKPKLMWNRVETFARIVAKHLGDLEVTFGITGDMILSRDIVQDQHGYKLPKYFWKAFEYTQKSKTYGIIVVLNYNSFAQNGKLCANEINCAKNGWLISNDDYQSGEIYCCSMNEQNIRQLRAHLLIMKERETFNLNTWKDKVEIIQKEFNAEKDRQPSNH